MLRLCIVLLSITALSLGLAWVGDEPGRVVIDWAQYHIETSVLVLIAATAVLAACCTAFYGAIYLLLYTPRRWARSRLARRQMRGLEALTEAIAAIATQDTGEAKKQIARAQLLLPHQPLPLMLAAQVARAEGNESQSRLYLEQMSKTKVTGFLALRGLMENARRSGDDASALRYGEQALALKPQDRRLIHALAGIYVKLGRMQQALAILESSARKRHFDRQEARRLSAYVLYENARMLLRHHRDDFAIAVLEDVLRKLPDFAPAAAKLAEVYTKKSEGKRALKTLSLAWKAAPHPALTAALLAGYDSGAETEKVLNAAQKMGRMHPENTESRYLLAEIAIRQKDLATACAHLRPLTENASTARACMLMAEVERLDGDHQEAAEWLKRAGNATPNPSWVCGNCHHATPEWHFLCPECDSAGSMEWK